MSLVRASVPTALDGERVDRAVALLGGLSRSEVADLVRAGRVRLSGLTVSARSRRVETGDTLEVDLPEPGRSEGPAPDPAVEVPVVWADDEVVVVDKPPGVVVHPGAGNRAGTLVQGLVARFPDLAAAGAGERDRPGIVQRLDKGTSGLLVVARTAAAHRSLVAQLAARSVERRYLALVLGLVEADSGVVEAPVGRSGRDPTRMAVSRQGRPARTTYRVERRYHRPSATLVDCRLETGRTHQVRVHMAAIGHPVAGDGRYGPAGPAVGLERPFLHAHRLSFDHPGTGERLSFSSPLPADLEAVLSRLSS